jgi:hypothetical protein
MAAFTHNYCYTAAYIHILRMPGNSPGKRPPAPDLSSAGAEQGVVAQSSDRNQFFHHTGVNFGEAQEFLEAQVHEAFPLSLGLSNLIWPEI